MDQPKIERLLRLMKMLTGNSRYSVDDLAQRLEMSRRTIYRYIDTFREAGFVIKRSGEYIRLDKESPHFKDISQLVHFSDEEAIILRRSIESIDDSNMLKADLKRKLYSIYDNGVISSGKISGMHSKNIHALLSAIENHHSVVLKSYRSAHSSVVRDRFVEPFAFTAGYVQVWCYDREDGRNKLFKSSRIGEVLPLEQSWACEAMHKKGVIDIFRMNGEEQIEVVLNMGILSANLLLEEYPLSERELTQIDTEQWQLKTNVASFVGVGRFVVGLIDDIEVVSPPEFREYLNSYVKKIEEKIFVS